jgi:hypothetical protein
MMWLLLAQLAVWQPVVAPTLHQGYWQSCEGAERVLEHRVNGYLLWELHTGPADQFALYAFKVDGPDHSHEGGLNLLGTPQADSLQTYRGARQWAVPSLHLWISVVRAGDAPVGCDAFFIKVVKQ